MAINFPTSTSVGDIYTYNGYIWEYVTGGYWKSISGQEYIYTASTAGGGASVISGITSGNLYLKSFIGDNITIFDSGDVLTFSAGTGGGGGGTFTGGTVTGPTNFISGLTANTISATTYYNLPVSAITNGTGITASTSNGSVTITNTAPDQTVTISGGTGITTGGTYPNFTITNSAPDQTVTFSSGRGFGVTGSYPNFSGSSYIGNIITVGKSGDVDYNSIYDAVDSIVSSDELNRYTIYVGPGVYEEPYSINLDFKPYVNIVGCDINSVLVKISAGTNDHVFQLGNANELSFMTIRGAPTGYGAISVNDIAGFSLVHKISIYDCDYGIVVRADSTDVQFYGEYIDINGTYTYATYCVSNNGTQALMNLENIYTFPYSNSIQYFVTGSGSTLNVFTSNNLSNNLISVTGVTGQDYANLRLSSVSFEEFDISLHFPNNGGFCTFDMDGISTFNSITYDLYVQQQYTVGSIQGSLSHSKISNNAPNVYWQFLDYIDGELDITRKLSITFEDGSHTDTSTLIFQASTMGLISGGTLTINSGLDIDVSDGFGYVQKTGTEIYLRIDWSTSTLTLPASEENYIYYNDSSNLSYSSTLPEETENIILGRVVTNGTGVLFIDPSPVIAQHTSNRFSIFNRTALGPVYATGSIVTENVTNFRLDVSGGNYFLSENEYNPSGGTLITFTQFYRNGSGGWNTTATTVVNNTQFDNNTGTLSALTTAYFTKHTLYVLGDGTYEKYFLVLGQAQYSTLIATENADLPLPPTYFNDAVTPIASIYIQQGYSGITEIEDIRPVIGFKAGGVNASSLHANLLGLSADDHTQYLLVNGARGMSGSLNMSGNTITSAGTINGVTIETHAARHKSGGSDPVGTSTPTASAIPYADAFGKLDGWITPVAITGGTNIRIVGTYPNFGVNLSGGTTNYIPRWTGTTALGNSQIQDDGTYLGIGITPSSPIKLWVYTNTLSYGIRGDGTSAGVYGQGFGSGKGVYGSSTSSIGVQGVSAGDTGTNIGVQGTADIVDSGAPTNVGGQFLAQNGGSNYSVQLQDGTEGTNKVLISKTSDGKANWSDTLTGLTSVSATTYYNLPVSGLTQGSNITITNNGNGNFTIASTGGGGGGASLGTVYTTGNNLNFI
jgi:hypothetical protein